MIQLGRWNDLTITRFTDHGAYVDGGETGEILMPRSYVKPEMRPGDEVHVFVYLDQEERLVATMEQPLAQVGEFAFLRVAWVNQFGAFLDWGLMYNPQIQIFADSETKRPDFGLLHKTKRSKIDKRATLKKQPFQVAFLVSSSRMKKGLKRHSNITRNPLPIRLECLYLYSIKRLLRHRIQTGFCTA